jgi:hypothetical protein
VTSIRGQGRAGVSVAGGAPAGDVLVALAALDRVSYRPGLDQAARDYIVAAILQRVHGGPA